MTATVTSVIWWMCWNISELKWLNRLVDWHETILVIDLLCQRFFKQEHSLLLLYSVLLYLCKCQLPVKSCSDSLRKCAAFVEPQWWVDQITSQLKKKCQTFPHFTFSKSEYLLLLWVLQDANKLNIFCGKQNKTFEDVTLKSRDGDFFLDHLNTESKHCCFTILVYKPNNRNTPWKDAEVVASVMLPLKKSSHYLPQTPFWKISISCCPLGNTFSGLLFYIFKIWRWMARLE